MNITKHLDELLGIYMYILELQNGKHYVGITHNINERIDEHKSGDTSKFVNPNLPIISYNVELLKTTDRKEAIIIETKKTIELIHKYGIENVAGGKITGDLKRRIRWYLNVMNNKKYITND